MAHSLNPTPMSEDQQYPDAGAEYPNLATGDCLSLAKLEEGMLSKTSQELVNDSRLLSHSLDDLHHSICKCQDVFDSDPWPIAELDRCLLLHEVSARETCTHVDADAMDESEEESASQIFNQWLKNNSHSISMADLRNIKLKTSTIDSTIRRLGGGKKGLGLFLKFVLMWVQNCHRTQSSQPAPSSEGCNLELGLEIPCDTSTSFLFPFNVEENWPSNYVSTLSLQCGNDPLQNAESSNHQNCCSSIALQQIPPVVMTNGCDHGGYTDHFESCSPNDAWLENDEVLDAPRSFGLVWNSLKTDQSKMCAKKCLEESYDPNDAPRIDMLTQRQGSDGIPASTTQAARKSRMERQRWSFRRRVSHKWSNSSAGHYQHHRSTSRHTDVLQWPILQSFIDSDPQYQKLERNLRLLFYKELKQSDVGSLGRIVLPKKAAETCLPPLESRDGVYLAVDDFSSSKVWNIHYRFWPNHKSRMYLFENIGDFVKSYSLKEGDYMLLYFNLENNRYMVRATKVTEALCNDTVKAEGTNIIAMEEAFSSGMTY